MIFLHSAAYVYIMANTRRTVVYIGSTTNIRKRISDHRNLIGSGFTAKYRCRHLVYLETFDRITEAAKREKQLKNWRRNWKNDLITSQNPGWEDLFPKLFG
ncbi:MAG: GIY-YIG nuclease family protein [Bacteroidota bacterium]